MTTWLVIDNGNELGWYEGTAQEVLDIVAQDVFGYPSYEGYLEHLDEEGIDDTLSVVPI